MSKIKKKFVEGNTYYPDYNESDQLANGNGMSAKDYIDKIGSGYGKLIFQHNDTSISGTDYNFTISGTITKKISVEVEDGAVLNGAETLTINGPFKHGRSQCFGLDITINFGDGSIEYVIPQWWGAAGDGSTDDTLAIQASLTTGENVYVPDGTYILDIDRVFVSSALGSHALEMSSNQKLTLSANTLFQADISTSIWAALVGVYDKTGVIIEGGKWKGDKDISAEVTEHHHNIKVLGSTNVTVKNVYSYKARGDGIMLGKGTGKCENVIIDNVICDDNYRQGMSIVYADHVKVSNSTFKDTDGTNPEDGVDCETDGINEQEDIVFVNCTFKDNTGAGLDTIRSQNVRAIGCTFDGNLIGARSVGDEANSLIADLTLIGCEIKDNTQANLCIHSNFAEMKVTMSDFTGTPSQSHINFNDLGGTSRQFTLKDSKLELTGVTSIFSWTHADVSSIMDISGNEFYISAAVEVDYLRGSKIHFADNKYYLLTGFTTASLASDRLINTPISGTKFIGCEFYNATTNSCRIGLSTAKAENCYFDSDIVFEGVIWGGQYDKSATDISTSGVGEDDLRSYVVPADSMGLYGGIKITAGGTKTGANGNKTLKLNWGGTTYTFHVAANDINDWRLDAIIVNYTASTQKISYVGYNGTTIVQDYAVVAKDTTAAVTVKITGECDHASDIITQSLWIVEKL